ncbi:hypothetical protein [Marinobacter nauticus]|uniref:hypothetical protein n=1 Tax=Marinobacter nauticus TaxID=2743 RepID=UPI0012FB8160|nr:hypothetical protein [Marinobacter nauticus]
MATQKESTIFYGLWQAGRLGTYGCLLALVVSFFTPAISSNLALGGAALFTALFGAVVWYGTKQGLLVDRFAPSKDND